MNILDLTKRKNDQEEQSKKKLILHPYGRNRETRIRFFYIVK